MSRPVTGYGFHGMNNLPRDPADLLDDAKKITPRIAMNVEVTDGSVLIKRQGHVRKINLPGVHSLWAGSIMLAVAAGVLYRVEGTRATAITAVDNLDTRMAYAEIDNSIYMANPCWQGVLELLTGTVRSWGVSLPALPSFSLVPGDLPPGTYTLCYTRAENGRISGNGPLVQVSWEGGAQGIQLNNLPAGGQCWITQPNGQKLFLANVVGGVVVGQVPQAIPLPSFSVAPPPGLSDFCQAFGRIWGINGKQIVYSDPFQYEWFRTANFIPFLEDLTMVAPVNDGLFVSSFDSTWFLDGTVPGKMIRHRVGDGTIPGTVTIAQMPGAIVGGGYEISRKLSMIPSPVWLSKKGFVVGTQTGHLVHLTESRLKMIPRTQGASLFRVNDGRPQILVSMTGAQVVVGEDTELNGICRDGQLFIS